VGRFAAAPGLTDEQYTIFVATGLTHVGREADGVEEEHMTVEQVRLTDVRDLIDAGEIVDAKTAIGLLHLLAGQ
jgi:ADP-ribose pyrophosphatase